MSAIMMSQIKVTNPEIFQNYLEKSKTIASRYGAELMFRGKKQGVLNGQTGEHQMLVIARFPDMASIDAWSADPEYQALIPLREEGSEQVMVTYDEAV